MIFTRYPNSHRMTAYVLALFLCLAGASSLQAQTTLDKETLKKTQDVFSDIAKKASPSVVFIEVDKKVTYGQDRMMQYGDPFEFFGPEFFDRFFRNRIPDQRLPNRRTPERRTPDKTPPRQRYQAVAQGSGFIITPDGYILTNNHIAGEADRLKVKLSDGREFQAKVIGTDPPSDVAVIKIEATNLPALTLGNSDEIDVGYWVIAIGNPFGLNQTVTSGIISAKGRSNVGITEYEDFIQTDAAINPGNSGGPLLNLDGKVIGINSAIVSQSGGYMGIGFAIPVNMAKSIYDQLIKSGSVTRGFLGIIIQEMTPDLAKSFDIKEKSGIVVSEVTKDSPAEKGGLKQGDVVLEVDNAPVKDSVTFRNRIATTAPGKSVDLLVMREGQKKSLTITVGKKPSEGEEKEKASSSADQSADIADKLGFEVQNLTDDLAEQFNYKGMEGVIVSQVEPGSPASEAGIHPGILIQEVNRKPVKNVGQFEKAIAESQKSGTVLLLVKDGRASLFKVLKVDG